VLPPLLPLLLLALSPLLSGVVAGGGDGRDDAVLSSAALLPLLPLLLSDVVDGGIADRDGNVLPLSLPLENGVVAAAISSELCLLFVLAESSEGIVDGHFPFTGSEPSGHNVGGGSTVLLPPPPPPPLLSLPLLEDAVVAEASSVDVFVSSELRFFAAKTVVEYSNVKAAVVTDKRRIKIMNVEII
jgi:hypothetical protein